MYTRPRSGKRVRIADARVRAIALPPVPRLVQSPDVPPNIALLGIGAVVRKEARMGSS